MPSQATLSQVFDAGQVRLTQFAREYVRLREEGLPYMRPVLQGIDLRLGLERAAKLPAGREQDVVLRYLINTYGLLAVGLDPFLRGTLPLIPGVGATVRYRVRGANGRARRANAKLLLAGAYLQPASLT